MKTGESVTDSQGKSWTVGQQLGRGAASKSFVARADTGEERVLQVALDSGDLFGDDAETLADVCNRAMADRARWMRDRHRPWLPTCSDSFTTQAGATALFMHRFSATLQSRLQTSCSLASVLEVLITAAEHAQSGPHGNLHPSNILLGDDGSVYLSDPITDAMRPHRARLQARMPKRPDVLPHEATAEPAQVWDTHALCAALYTAIASCTPDQDGPRSALADLPREGLDRVALSAAKDRVLARLQQERANPRFAHRVSEKLGAVLNRGLSRQAQPSPPYRFHKTSDLRTRLVEVRDLIDPRVEQVGKVLLASTAQGDVFEGGHPASFSTTVSCTHGVGHEDLAAGLLVRDLDAEGDGRIPVPDARYTVKPHPSGRLRFDFTLPALRPGRYVVRAAFTVKDSGHEPQTAEGHFEIRPPPGYVPPVEQANPDAGALRFPGAQAPDDNVIEPIVEQEQPFGHAAFPTPIAPSDPGLLADLEPAPAHLRALPTPPPTADPVSSASGYSPPVSQSGVPSIAPAAVSPSIVVPAHAPPGLRVSPSFAPGLEPDVTAKVDTPPPDPSSLPAQREWNNPGQWAELPPPDAPLPAAGGFDPLLPSAESMQDLPSIDGSPPAPSGIGDAVEKLVNVVRDNTIIALIATVGGLIGLLALSGLLINSCAG